MRKILKNAHEFTVVELNAASKDISRYYSRINETHLLGQTGLCKAYVNAHAKAVANYERILLQRGSKGLFI